MIDKINNSPLFETENSNQAKARKCMSENDTDATFRTDYDLLISRVIENSENETKRVEQARKLLVSGQLDSIENIYKAAVNIAKFGV